MGMGLRTRLATISESWKVWSLVTDHLLDATLANSIFVVASSQIRPFLRILEKLIELSTRGLTLAHFGRYLFQTGQSVGFYVLVTPNGASFSHAFGWGLWLRLSRLIFITDWNIGNSWLLLDLRFKSLLPRLHNLLRLVGSAVSTTSGPTFQLGFVSPDFARLDSSVSIILGIIIIF